MDEPIIHWDPAKARRNLRDHGVSFEEEDRFLLLGSSAGLRLLVVVHSYRELNVIRIISARKATPSERAQYETRWKR